MTQTIGILITINSLIICGSWAYNSPDNAKGPITFGILGALVGLAIYLGNQFGHIKGLGFELAAAQQDVETISRIRKDMESQQASIKKIAEEAEAAKTQIDEVKQLATDAETSVKELRNVTEFATLVLRAQSYDKNAFEKLSEIANGNGPYRQIAITVLHQIDISAREQSQRAPKKPDWESIGIDPETASLKDFKNALKKLTVDYHRSVLQTAWGRNKGPYAISVVDRLKFLIDVIEEEPDLLAISTALSLASEETLVVGTKEELIDWVDKHASEYTSDAVCYLKFIHEDGTQRLQVTSLDDKPMVRFSIAIKDMTKEYTYAQMDKTQSQYASMRLRSRDPYSNGMRLLGKDFYRQPLGTVRESSNFFPDEGNIDLYITIYQLNGTTVELASRRIVNGKPLFAYRVFRLASGENQERQQLTEVTRLRHVDEGFPVDKDGNLGWVDSTGDAYSELLGDKVSIIK